MSTSKMKRSLFAACILLVAAGADAQPPVHRRALLIGINDYTASRLGKPPSATTQQDRDWLNLNGAVNDVAMLQEMLTLLYGVDRRDIVTLTDQAATRAAILQGLENLATNASKDNVLLFYFAGHGSQVKNSLSDERDKMDESIVPADSRLGVRDIRDKVLREYFNRMVDRGARLTIILDNCHSGSGARGLPTGARPRGIKPDYDDVADRAKPQRPERNGALVLSATEDFDKAWETRDAEGKFHGVFTWAWIRAMRDASSGEPAKDTFLRAQARMRAETPFQDPVMAGNAEAKLAPFLGLRIDRRHERAVVAVSKVRDGTIVLEGGWANGLAAGTELQDPATSARLTITAVRGLAQSEARLASGPAPQSGALLEVVAWAAPPGRPLRVAMPRAAGDTRSLAALARTLAAEAAQHGVRWLSSPIDAPAGHLLRWGAHEWELISSDGSIEHLGSDAAAIAAAIAKMPAASSLFVQFPAAAELVDGIHATSSSPEEADYVLVGRYVGRHLTYAWLRPLVRRSDKRNSGLPQHTNWVTTAPQLDDALTRLRRIHAWQILESPTESRFPYGLRIRRARDDLLLREGASIVGGEKYVLVLQPTVPYRAAVKERYVYVFVVDSHGQSTLLFPPSDLGSVENRFPTSPSARPDEITLEGSEFGAAPPYGVDTYYFLSTENPLPDPSILEWDGIRAPQTQPHTPLEQLLALTAAGTRSTSLPTPASWSIERVTYESLSPRATKATR